MLSVVIVEDEAASRARLRRLLGAHADRFAVIAEAENGLDAIQIIREVEPRVVFMDIALPGCTGFEVLKATSSKPAVIFTTAYQEHALDAFRANAIDYLLKPVEPDLLAAALAKVSQRLPEAHGPSWADMLTAMRQLAGNRPRRLACRLGDSTMFVEIEEVRYFRADRGYTLVKTAARELLVDTPLVELEQGLDEADFIRIHRNTLVNMRHVSLIKRSAGSRTVVVLSCGTELLASRRYSEHLKSAT